MTGALLLLALTAGCRSSQGPELVVYSALDRPFCEPVLEQFQQETGVRVLANYDIESTKTVSLVRRIIQESNRPRCDVFWNNEPLHTLRLQKQGLLAPYMSPAAADFPAMFKSAEGYWYGFAARARVLIVNTSAIADRQRWPNSIEDLTDPQWKGKVAVAKPLFGTTATHAAVLFAHWGRERAKQFFRRLHDNADILSGNRQVAEAVAARRYAFGLTDTDDAIIQKEQGADVDIVFPDQGPGQMGTLLVPNTVCLIRGGPNPQAARQLIDYLLRPEVERRLALGRSAQLPLNPAVQMRPRLWPQQAVHWMEADFEKAAQLWDEARQLLETELMAD